MTKKNSQLLPVKRRFYIQKRSLAKIRIAVDQAIKIIYGSDNTTQVNVCKQFSIIHICLPVCLMKDLY